ncbi:hypothetical protein CRT60_01050 [Azospirillum palustre]|uniref:Uncharacterized protein n=1 Tax=Azospirillum palustre TaxID=2044885 RepID=A0A2B8BNE1_9PROT|nr:hypothetical protein CRT60_01050 [Azospirillum palustre]
MLLRRNSENPYDEDAVEIWLTAAALVASEMPIPPDLAGDPRPEWMLGHLPASTGEHDYAALFSAQINASVAVQACVGACSGGGRHDLVVRLSGPAVAAVKTEIAAIEARREAERLEDEMEWAMRTVWPDERRRQDESSWAFQESQRVLRGRRQQDLEAAFGLRQDGERRRVRSSIENQAAYLADLRKKTAAAIANGALNGDEAKAAKKLLRHLEGLEEAVGAMKKARKTAQRRKPALTRRADLEEARSVTPAASLLQALRFRQAVFGRRP